MVRETIPRLNYVWETGPQTVSRYFQWFCVLGSARQFFCWSGLDLPCGHIQLADALAAERAEPFPPRGLSSGITWVSTWSQYFKRVTAKVAKGLEIQKSHNVIFIAFYVLAQVTCQPEFRCWGTRLPLSGRTCKAPLAIFNFWQV